MKVMLIQPLSSTKVRATQPLGLGYLASSLEKTGHNVRIIDSLTLKYNIGDIKREFLRLDPNVVGITATTQDIYEALSIAKIVKVNNPNCMTVLGGPHPTVRSREILENYPYVDVIVRGEGEKTLIELLEKKKKEDFAKVRGISFRLNGRIIENKDREIIEDLDSLPFPAYHLLSMNRYKVKLSDIEVFEKKGQLFSNISTSRGCPYNCIFCSSRKLWGIKCRVRSPEKVVEELKLLGDKYDVRIFNFTDDVFTLNKRRIDRICKLIRDEGIDITWDCSTRVNLFTKNIAIAMKKAGCRRVFFGFESGVQKTLDFLNKDFRLEDSEKAVKIAKDAGLNISGHFIIGVPGETKEMINKTIAFARKLNLIFSTFSVLVPYPGTKIYEIAEKNNLLLTRDWSRYTLFNPVMKIPGFTTRELKGFLIKSYLICNFKFSTVKIIKKLKTQ